MPKKNPLNSGNPKIEPIMAILSESCGNIRSVQRLTAQTERLRSGYITLKTNVNTVGQMALNVTKKSRSCVNCKKKYIPSSNRQMYCSSCKEIVNKTRAKNYMKTYYKERYVRKGYDQYGEKNNNWKGGIGIFTKLVDKKCCERCSSEKFLLIHHKDENRYNNDKSNLEVLCKRCHQIHHKCWEALGIKLSSARAGRIKAVCKV
jgi:hypothetical protein